MSYTNKKVEWLKCSDTPIQDMYGDIKHNTGVLVKVRKQPKQDLFKNDFGQELLSKSYFYADPSVEPNALSIKYHDLLDGERVEHIYVMCTLSNKPRMVRFITI